MTRKYTDIQILRNLINPIPAEENEAEVAIVNFLTAVSKDNPDGSVEDSIFDALADAYLTEYDFGV